MVPLNFIHLRTISRHNVSVGTLLHGFIYRPFCHCPVADSSSSAPPSSTVVKRVCFWVCDSYYNNHPRKKSHSNSTRSVLNLPIDSDFLTTEQAITVVASLADEAGSMVAMSFFYWAVGTPKFRHFMRFYIVSATCLIKNGNFERAHEVLRCMVRNVAEIGMLREAVDVILEMPSQGLVLTAHTLNCVLSVVSEMGCYEIAENVFDEIALKIFNKMVEMGFEPNIINFSCLINGLSRRGSIKQSFEILEEMVRIGLKPNVYTHTALIDGLCKKGWTDKAFRLFLKLVRSESYKPNVHTYTAMISGYCKEEKMNRAEMLLVKMQEQGLVPNSNTYTTLIGGHAKVGDFDRAYELMDKMGKDCLTPTTCTYNAVIDGLCKRGRVKEAYGLMKTSFRNGICADKFTYTVLIYESCKQDNIKQALALTNKMMKIGIAPDMHTYTTLISSLSRQKKIRECERIFWNALDKGLAPTTQTYTSMICGYCRDNKVDMAVKFFHKMRDNGCTPDSFTYGALISGLCKESKLDEAKRFFDEMMNRGISPPEVTRLTIAYEFCRKGESLTAMVLLDRLDKKLWIRTVRTLVRKLCSEQKVEMAAQFFDKLLEVNHAVDRVTLAAFMSACYDSNNYALVSDMSRKMTKEKDPKKNRQDGKLPPPKFQRSAERASCACWHWRRFRAVPPLEQRVRTASDSSGQAAATRHSARDRLRWRHAASRDRPAGIRRWQSVSAR
ncbi:pentatricopeptide repeat-containing protein [Striga asiatica]|uniref:Pentatricopeptide repeat-containing protein n=1 Tax=Striga asiatica TaxID=4170 RepID=A0A5A7Q9B3_STRAF|nr:pentatricopeptide repeat-containing protein [Striga asiatica]